MNHYDELNNIITSCESALEGETCPKLIAELTGIMQEAKSELRITYEVPLIRFPDGSVIELC